MMNHLSVPTEDYSVYDNDTITLTHAQISAHSPGHNVKQAPHSHE